ncbi:LuxR family two component transcriptional regulator [Hydrogenispora ethanolica]|uniref:LuxR family two component transcriptional regulator n=1 Tax=Hydrogenispora ethanolica TaxID=1082276 RepID=A0A4R1RGD4_HYDET|nr:response regulator transcription factor [Hydrogenispora ethanolica]TCL64760.1 LuxR family two component transcriptional regulator [Hydrogenispora ethanolica]
MVSVLIAEDHHLVRQGIKALLEKETGIKVVGEAEDGQMAVDMVMKLVPDVVLMDIAMPRLNGTQAIQKIKMLDVPTRVIVLSMYSDLSLVRQSLRNGAKGYLLKRSVTEELILAIKAAKRGEIFITPIVSAPLISEIFNPTASNTETELDTILSSREMEVLQLVAEGHTNNSIASLLNITVKTVEKHRARMMSKLNVHDTAGLVRIAIKHNVVFLDTIH